MAAGHNTSLTDYIYNPFFKTKLCFHDCFSWLVSRKKHVFFYYLYHLLSGTFSLIVLCEYDDSFKKFFFYFLQWSFYFWLSIKTVEWGLESHQRKINISYVQRHMTLVCTPNEVNVMCITVRVQRQHQKDTATDTQGQKKRDFSFFLCTCSVKFLHYSQHFVIIEFILCLWML